MLKDKMYLSKRVGYNRSWVYSGKLCILSIKPLMIIEFQKFRVLFDKKYIRKLSN